MSPVLEAENAIRVAFLDASHLYHDVMAEVELVMPKLTQVTLLRKEDNFSLRIIVR
jgi:hypothetical protein